MRELRVQQLKLVCKHTLALRDEVMELARGHAVAHDLSKGEVAFVESCSVFELGSGSIVDNLNYAACVIEEAANKLADV